MAPAGPGPWTCPFCPLACDHVGVGIGGETLTLEGSDCPRARAALSQFEARAPAPTASIDGRPCDVDAALAAASALLAASRQPLFGGLGTDVAGSRALYPLACASGAICEPAGGEALMRGLGALQDRGQYTTTLAEVRTRADLIVFVGGVPADVAPLIGLRCGIGDPERPRRRVVVLGPRDGDRERLAAWAGQGAVEAESVALHGDLFDTLAVLSARVAGGAPPGVVPALEALAQWLREARYAVLVGAPARLPAHGELIIEAVHRLVAELNRTTRAAALWIGGADGAATVHQVFAWLSGLPLRSRLGPHGLEHEPRLFDAGRLFAEGAVDAVLWVASFDAASAPPPHRLPMVVLGPPALQPRLARDGVPTVFVAVSTPGIGSPGHLFRTDGTVLMPLAAARPDALPTVADVASRLLAGISGRMRPAEEQPFEGDA
jgi:formylmethanofuran dehydrogenase subunit B